MTTCGDSSGKKVNHQRALGSGVLVIDVNPAGDRSKATPVLRQCSNSLIDR